MGVVITDNSKQFLERLADAFDQPGGGLDVGSKFLAGKIKESMYSSGATNLPNDTPTKLQPPSAPGSPPSVKTGRLAGSITNARVGTLRWAAGTNVEYARIHEFGGTIAHPGGTHYFIGKDGMAVFVSEKKGLQMALEGKKLGRTKPHNITLPARPYLRPSLNNNKKRLSKEVNDRVRQLMGGTS